MSKSFSCQETKRLFNQQNINKFNQILEKIDITPIFNEHNPNYAIESLIGTNSQGCTQPQKKGADIISTSSQTWGMKTPPHIFFSVNHLDYSTFCMQALCLLTLHLLTLHNGIICPVDANSFLQV